MKNKNQTEKSIGFSFFQRLSLYAELIFLFVDIILFLVFLMGNYQGFSDRSQQMILTVLSVFSFLLISFSIINFISHVISLFRKKRTIIKSIVQMIAMILCMFIGLSLLFFSNMMNVISAGF